jgi:hypothetical protein
MVDAKFSKILEVITQRPYKFGVERFNLRNSGVLWVRRQYHIQFGSRLETGRLWRAE